MAAPCPTTVTIMSSEPTKLLHPRTTDFSRTCHPIFSFPDANVVLRSLEGTLYRMHSFTLRTTSGFFDTMFSLPQPKTSAPARTTQQDSDRGDDVLDVYESDFPMERLLSLMSGLPIPKWESLDEIERVLNLAEKWDTPGPLASLRSALSSQPFLQAKPLRCYVLATHFGWTNEAKLASKYTLSLDLYDPIHDDQLEQLSSKDLLPLLNLHRKRRDMFRELLNSPERFTAGNSTPYHCNRCGVTELENHTWRELKNRMFLEMERRPSGDTLGLVIGETAEWPEARACWEAKCSKKDCGGFNYDRVATLRQILACVALLPSTVE
ncbi:hypothetical protein CPB83DRAFT_606492 [Crepidotus variabilis]|uniref:BTB domain-containing protein n=1 Tax=Crepidotus variabilis TaxID=179855 RepID=A0A9P6E8S6_9AGAR|nr:hypothetical protein CPB83DRAFT_606492 [Crepidotus variabilis]